MQVVGLIVPSSNTVMEPDFHRHAANGMVVSTTRIFLEQVTREAELRMLREELPPALRLIQTVRPCLVVFGCTSAGSLEGIQHDRAIARLIEESTGARAITVLGSVLAQFAKIRPKRAAVFTPYQEELTQSVAGCVVQGGYEVVKAAGMGIVENRDIGKVAPEEIVNFVMREMRGVGADCVFLSCTNWRAMEALEPLRRVVGVPVLSSNQACIDEVLLALGEGA